MFCILSITLEVFTIKIPSTNLTGLRSDGTERFCVLITCQALLHTVYLHDLTYLAQ